MILLNISNLDVYFSVLIDELIDRKLASSLDYTN